MLSRGSTSLCSMLSLALILSSAPAENFTVCSIYFTITSPESVTNVTFALLLFVRSLLMLTKPDAIHVRKWQ